MFTTTCPGCEKSFKGERGLTAHVSQNRACQRVYLRTPQVYIRNAAPPPDREHPKDRDSTSQNADMASHIQPRQHQRLPSQHHSSCSLPPPTNENNGTVIGAMMINVSSDFEDNNISDDITVLDMSSDNHHSISQERCDSQLFASDDDNSEEELSMIRTETDADREMLEIFQSRSETHVNPLNLSLYTKEQEVHVKLLQLLQTMKAPLSAFSSILKWASSANELGHNFCVNNPPSREKVLKDLFHRFNMQGLRPREKSLYLPFTKRYVSIIYFDVREVLASLLMCPTLNQDCNFLFSDDDDPFAGPPDTNILGDINTGQCYRKTYEKYVKNPQLDMILPCILAMDKTNIDTFGRLKMEPITISHGLLKHSVRSTPAAMRILGFINHTPHVSGEGFASEDMFHTHSFPECDVSSGSSSSGKDNEFTIPSNLPFSVSHLNEYHLQIQFILQESGYLSLQENGFHWKLKFKNTLFPVILHPYVPFIIGDTEGHDRLCGHYTSRCEGVSQLCRICECPLQDTNKSRVQYRYRTPRTINNLVEAQDLVGLQALSQHFLRNGFADVRFGAHNNRGIFGACPGEMLHLISLGWFKYCLTAFKSQIGKTSVRVEEFDVLCSKVGQLLCRQSDRTLPRTNFPNGILSGSHLMGHEYSGCLLIMLFALHCTAFTETIFPQPTTERELLKIAKDRDLSNPNHVYDWIRFISYLLQWHEWLKQGNIKRSQVRKSPYATQMLIRRLRYVSPRVEGMGTKTIKVHLVLHLCQDILDHGVPSMVDSSYAESAHIPIAKSTARRTQKRAVSFVKQAAERYVENIAISQAVSDINNQASKSHQQEISNDDPVEFPKACGRSFVVCLDSDDNAMMIWRHSSSSSSQKKVSSDEMASLPVHVMKFLCRFCLPHVQTNFIPCFTEVSFESGQTYRAHPKFHNGRPWFDHCFVQWAEYRYPLPAKIHTFVDLTSDVLKSSIFITSSQQRIDKPGLYAVVHSLEPINDDDILDAPNVMIIECTEYFATASSSENPTLYLINVESISSPAVCIRNIGSPMNNPSFLVLYKSKDEWPKCWDSMIESEYNARNTPNPDSDEDSCDDEVIRSLHPIKRRRKRKRQKTLHSSSHAQQHGGRSRRRQNEQT